ncbi:MAG: tRNA (guanosine(37)-N1)-methyltransferase TrmD [Bowdeniella nasicola]|nr:tRNA (guanosine(37)-N1)-methyltransferase TrmD [Bowdeniella nasicola]
MRIDIVTIFPDYFAPLDLSLIGKARESELLDIRVHDLREHATDRHRTVDDTPAGGGAGMVMRPDVWGKALDPLLADGAAHLLVPTPSGAPLTQDLAQRLAGENHLVFACGRYEGIDARVAEHYGERVRVTEFSIGDYVLNGGEVAALVAIETIGRLVPGVLGNPDSLIEESHGTDRLLEYPVYTRPTSWRGRDIPPVLLGGDHGAIRAWRRAAALTRTAERRPDLLREAPLTMEDRVTLADAGWVVRPERVERLTLRRALSTDAQALADLAARTFPDACPPELGHAAIRDFIENNLSVAVFRSALADDTRPIWLAEADGRPVGYSLAILGLRPEEEVGVRDVRHHLPKGRVAEISKFYVERDYRATGLARALMRRVLTDIAAFTPRVAAVWLGTNRSNVRATRFYRACGLRVTGSRTFDVGGEPQDDVIITFTKLARLRPDMAD